MSEQTSLAAKGLDVRFGAVQAVAGVDIEINGGEVVGLLGANGAGKSTLMKTLAGIIPASRYEGEITLGGTPLSLSSPRDGEAHGIGLVPQELLAVPESNVLDNLFLGRHPARGGAIDYGEAREAGQRVLEAVGSDADLSMQMGSLSASSQQLIQIARTLLVDPRFILFDEPTSSLTPPEVERLLETIRGLARDGHGILLVTHRLPEVLDVADRLFVMRDGRSAGEWAASKATPPEIVGAMLGRELKGLESGHLRPTVEREAMLTVEGLRTTPSRGGTALADVSFEVRKGEIVGVFGLLGAGRTELLEALFGVSDTPAHGNVVLDGERLRGSVGKRIRAGMALVTEDRKKTGLVLEMSIAQNTSMACLGRISRWSLLDDGGEQDLAERYVEELGVKASSVGTPVGTLSGGNQQKVVIAKWLATDPKLLLLDEPTRGIDVGAKAEMFRILGGLADEGMSILLVTSEPGEAISLCDRVLVMYRGAIVAELTSDDIDEESLMTTATGASSLIGGRA